MARPNKYDTHVAPRLVEVADWLRNGATDEQIAKRLGIALSTFYEYKANEKFSEFSEVLKENKEYVDAQVESALLKRALGFDYLEVTKERNLAGKLVVSKIVKKHVVPDTTAQIFWLKNRRPKQWRDKPEASETDENVTEVEVTWENASGSDDETTS